MHNADAPLAASLRDFLIKVFRPNRYGCNLCEVTYNFIWMKRGWRDFVASLPYKSLFFTRDEFQHRYRATGPFPAAFVERRGKLRPLLAAEDLNIVHSVEELILLVRRRIASIDS